MTFRHHALNRRRFLSALGGAAALPLLPALTRAQGASPRRLVIFTSPNNWVHKRYWKPAGSGDRFDLNGLPDMLSPLEAHQDKLLMLGDMRNRCFELVDGNFQGGHAGMGQMLTGYQNIRWPDGDNENDYWGGGISVDQFVANRLGVDALTLGASSASVRGNGGARTSYTAANQPVTARHIPVEVYDLLFGDGGAPSGEANERNRRRRLVLGHSERRLSNLRARYGQVQGLRIERHMDSIATMRRRLVDDAATCSGTRPEEPNGYPSTIARQIDLLTEALACGMTQVATLQCGNTGGAESYSGGLSWAAAPELNQPAVSYSRSQHVIAHDMDQSPSDSNTRARLDIEKMYSRAFAYLLERMDSVMEEDGTMLDNSIVVHMKPMAINHSPGPMPYIVAGGAGGQLRLGRYEKQDGVPHNNLLVSLCRAMGLSDVTNFGDSRFCTGDVLGV